MIIAAFVAILIALVALLWYGIRTHKTVAQLESKIKASAGDITAYAINKANEVKADVQK